MKKFKKLASLLLCVLLAMTLLGSTLVSAKAKPVTLDVKMSRKTVRLIRDVDRRENTASMGYALKTWGKSYTVRKGENWREYTYKRGKSSISLCDYQVKNGRIGGIDLKVYDGNIAVAGVKVGTSLSSALKTLRKTYGTKAVTYSKGTIYVDMVEYMPMTFKIKSGKVASISWFRS